MGVQQGHLRFTPAFRARPRPRAGPVAFGSCESFRFYHQSFKVYWLQQQTDAIVRELSTLVPGQPLHPWFRKIVTRGTGKQFSPEHNARWTEVTRPILEGFFHARFFLEMAVRYAEFENPPSPLPSGYAALLYLYRLR